LIDANQYNMNKQIHALKIKLASMSDAKKINALKQLIRQIEDRTQ